MTPHSRCSDLRAQGYDITCKRVGFKQGRPVWSYQLVDALSEGDESSESGSPHRRRPAIAGPSFSESALRETTETESPLLGSSPVVSQSALSEGESQSALAPGSRPVDRGRDSSAGPVTSPSESAPEQLALTLPGSSYRKKEAA